MPISSWPGSSRPASPSPMLGGRLMPAPAPSAATPSSCLQVRPFAEQQEPAVALRQMTDGHNVIEDYSNLGLTQRQHRVAFLRKDLSARNIITCAEAMTARDGRWVYTAGLVLVRQKPGSAKGVMFITIEDETGPANLVVWPTLFEKRRRVVLGSSMMAINGRIQREGEGRPSRRPAALRPVRRPCRPG